MSFLGFLTKRKQASGSKRKGQSATTSRRPSSRRASQGRATKARKSSVQRQTAQETPVGKITHYFPHIPAGVVRVEKGTLRIGDTIHIKGPTTDFTQEVASMEIDHVPIRTSEKGKEIGLLVKERVRQNDVVYKIKA